jgi:hypothetical protein
MLQTLNRKVRRLVLRSLKQVDELTAEGPWLWRGVSPDPGLGVGAWLRGGEGDRMSDLRS